MHNCEKQPKETRAATETAVRRFILFFQWSIKLNNELGEREKVK